jgi:D-tyrosyl-tRNA(Tyr) deacylase
MRVVVQRVKEASVSVSEKIIGLIDHGLVVFVSFVDDDTMDDLDWMSKKIINLRIFRDKDDKMNDSLLDIDGNILLISQFTLHASTKKGNRPSFIKAAKPDFANDMYQKFIKILEEKFGKSIQTGEFGADMKVGLVNDGPTTIIIDSRDRE